MVKQDVIRRQITSTDLSVMNNRRNRAEKDETEACFRKDFSTKALIAERDDRSRRRNECLLFITNGTAP